jgi:predicted dinucleotide-binding enzyme
VYKVFNGIWWKHLLEGGKPSGTPNRIALPIAGENGSGRELIHGIVEALGFDPVDAGAISESWRQQPGTPVYGNDFDAENTRRALAEATPERTSEWSARP